MQCFEDNIVSGKLENLPILSSLIDPNIEKVLA